MLHRIDQIWCSHLKLLLPLEYIYWYNKDDSFYWLSCYYFIPEAYHSVVYINTYWMSPQFGVHHIHGCTAFWVCNFLQKSPYVLFQCYLCFRSPRFHSRRSVSVWSNNFKCKSKGGLRFCIWVRSKKKHSFICLLHNMVFAFKKKNYLIY